jgi:hypothetical protein
MRVVTHTAPAVVATPGRRAPSFRSAPTVFIRTTVSGEMSSRRPHSDDATVVGPFEI